MPEPASRASRFFASLIDSGILTVIGMFARRHLKEPYGVETALILFGMLGLVQVALLGGCGQTLGKKLLGIRIVSAATGQNAGFVRNVLVRWVANGLLGVVPLYGLVDILFIFRGDRRCVHDMLAGTEVVRA